MILADFIESMNRLGQEKVPFLFMVDFEMANPLIVKLNDVDPKEILYSIQGFTNANINSPLGIVSMEKSPGSLLDYKKKFDKVLESP